MNGPFEPINKSKYLTVGPTNESKQIMKNIMNHGVKSQIELFQ